MFQRKSWELRVTAAPRIPRGVSYLNSLRKILLLIQDFPNLKSIPEIEGSNSKATLEQLCVRLRPLGFLSKHSTNGSWILSNFSESWLESYDNEELAYFIDSNLQFFSELIYLSKIPKKINDLLEAARTYYHLTWKDNNQVYDRLSWLIDLGYIEHIDFRQSYVATEEGLKYLDKYPSYDYTKILEEKDTTLEDSLVVSEKYLGLLQATPAELKNRKQSIGYTPRTTKEILEVTTNYLNLMHLGQTNIELIYEFSSRNYGIKPSSTKTFLTHLKHTGLIDQVSQKEYEVTKLGEQFLELPTIEHLVYIYHSKIKFILEILNELSKNEMTSKEITVLSVIAYGFERENLQEIRKRLNILELAKLIFKRKNKYLITNKGKNLLQVAKVQNNHKDYSEELAPQKSTFDSDSPVNRFIFELKEAARDSSNPNRLEKIIAEIFRFLGFKSEWLGGSGNIDILIIPKVAPAYSYTVNIDAKSTYSGTITDTLVDFDTLAEHKKKHNADYVVIVGIDFKNERLISRAREHNVGLLDVETLSQLMIQHCSVPISFSMYRLLFEQVGVIDISILDSEIDLTYRKAKLLKAITECLYENTSDEFTKGIMTQRDIYFVLKNTFQMKNLSPQEIEGALLFLASPYVDCIGGDLKKGFYAKGSLADAVQKFQFYANHLK